MPAIQPARLKQQAAIVVEHYYDPPALTRSLHHLFDYYSERAVRQGQLEKPKSLTPAYRVRSPVLNQVLYELTLQASKDADAALDICDNLWQQPYLEFRQLAIRLLGQLPLDPPEPVIERIERWITGDVELILLDEIFSYGMLRLRKESPDRVLDMVEGWLKSDSTRQQAVELRALLMLVKDPEFENLPAVIKLVQPLIRKAPQDFTPDVLDILTELARRSPEETAYWLTHTLEMVNSPDVPWFIRNSLKAFPANVAARLRSSLRTWNEQTLI